MVGVTESAAGNVPGRVEIEVVQIAQDAHEFGNRDRRMRVVEVDRRLVGQGPQIFIFAEMAFHDVLQRCGGKEVFLPQAQFLSRLVRIGRIKNPRQRFGLIAFAQGADMVARIEGVEQNWIDRQRAP